MLLQDLVAEEQKAGKLTRDDRDLLNSVRICDPVNPKSQFFSIYCSLGDLLGVPMAAGLWQSITTGLHGFPVTFWQLPLPFRVL